MNFRKDIQGLRALAVLFVLFFHLNPNWLPGGFIGVDIFFVISGFLMASIVQHKEKKGTFSLSDFYYKRIRRIVPAYYLLLAVIAICSIFVYIGPDIRTIRLNYFWAFLFNSNNYLASASNYFGASSVENPFLHTWTLALEMQFYLLLPLFFILFLKKKREV